MKKMTIMAAILAVLVIACDNGNGGGNGGDPQRVLTGIEITVPPTKTVYNLGEAGLTSMY